MHNRKASDEGNANLDQRHPGAPRDGKYQRDQKDESHLEEHGNADDESDEHYRPVYATLAEHLDERCRNPRCGAGLRHDFAEHGAERHDDGDEAEYVADAILKGFDRRQAGHSRGDTHRQRDNDKGDEGMQPCARDKKDERDYGEQGEEQELRVVRHSDARATMSFTISSGELRMS